MCISQVSKLSKRNFGTKYLVPIDKNFRETWIKVSDHEGHPVRQLPKDTETEIHGEIVGVDFYLCSGCEKCITVCPTQVFAPWTSDRNHHVVDPINDTDCIRCLACELVCPVEAICIEREGGSENTLKSLLEGSY
ncbi:4Fe-4S dicluster domain-containing protein [Candidatus Thorarchaeota archaeon]|nr:MAG: 4Fe-4S dicluster domain-containing protein [Candidatus Thorarchaeota archaeon]